jgi:hypothetical protein
MPSLGLGELKFKVIFNISKGQQKQAISSGVDNLTQNRIRVYQYDQKRQDIIWGSQENVKVECNLAK